MTCGIYSLCIGERCYVGCSMKIERRIWQHMWLLRRGKHKNSKLQALWDELGASSFSHTVLEVCAGYDDLAAAERKWIKVLGADINGKGVTNINRRQPVSRGPIGPLCINGKCFDNIADAASKLGLSIKTIYDYTRENGCNFTFRPRNKEVTVCGVQYPSVNEAARSLRTTKATIRLAIRKRVAPKSAARNPVPVQIGGVNYSSARAAARALNVHKSTIMWHLKRGTLGQFASAVRAA